MSFLPDALLTARGRKSSEVNKLVATPLLLCASHCVSNLYVNAVYNIFPVFVSLFSIFFIFGNMHKLYTIFLYALIHIPIWSFM